MRLNDNENPTALSRAGTADLRKQVAGPVLLPDDAGYQAECATFNLMSQVRPAVAIGATSAADVQAAVRFAAERNMPVAVLATGHQMVSSAEGAVLINMSRMNAVQIEHAQNLARVEGGARWRQVLDDSDKHGLAPVSGTSPTVGVVGYHLGGGASPILGRTHGYAADHVQAIEIVTADGGLRRITASSEPDLFWALRGGKGNFGVVTALEFTLFPIKRFYGGGLFFAGEHAAKLLRIWREWVTGLPPEMSSSIAFLRLPPLPMVPEPLRGQFIMHVRFSSLGSREEADRALASIRAIAPAVLDTIAEMPYRESGSLFLEPPAPVPWVERSTMLRDFPGEAGDALLSLLGPESGTALNFVELQPLGGALERLPTVPNAVPGRNARWSLFAVGAGRPDLAPVLEEQLAALIDTLAPWAQDEIMPNLLSARQGTTAKDMRAIYGRERYDRLAAIKSQYDPRNLFRMNHNIAPAARAETQADGDVDIRVLSYASDDAASLVEAANIDLATRYSAQLAKLGGANTSGLQNQPSRFVPPQGTFFVAFLDKRPVGCGGWVSFDTADDIAELKKIYVIPEARGRGIARRIIAAAEDSARAYGRRRMNLEVGIGQPEAIALYESCGYERIDNYGYFRDLPECRCYARNL